MDDGPGTNPPADLAAIPDAVPRSEPLHRFANRPYTVLGRDYVPTSDVAGYQAQGMASWYGRRYHGKPTSSGEPYDMYGMTAAHPTLPIPSYVRVTNPASGRSVVVRINDRGPFIADRLIDLSYTAAWKLDVLRGVTLVEVAGIDPTQPPEREPALSTEVVSAHQPTSLPQAGTYLQLGAFASAEAAERLSRRIEMRLGASLPAIHQLPAGNLIRVQVGPFTSSDLADQAAASLELETGSRPLRLIR